MNKNKFSLSLWKVIGWICAAGLLLAGFTGAQGLYSMSQLQQGPLNVPVPVLRQSRSTSCGEAAIVMIYNYVHPETPIDEQEVIEYASATGYYTAGLPPFTSTTNMVKIAQHYAGNISTGRVLSSGQGLSLLIRKLQSHQPVIIDVLSNFHNPDSEAHFVVVTGISLDPSREDAVVIQYNDPLTGTAKSADWAGSDGVWNAWQTNGDPGGSGWWMVISPPHGTS